MTRRLVQDAVGCYATGLPVSGMPCASMRMAAPAILDIFVTEWFVLVAPQRNAGDRITKVRLL